MSKLVSTLVPATLLLAALLACKAGEEDVKKLEDIKTRACACQDKACADKEFAAFKAYVQDVKNKRVSDEHAKRITDATTSATLCFMQQGITVSEIQSATK